MSNQDGTPRDTASDDDAEQTPSEAQPAPLAPRGAPRPPAEREVLMPLDPERVVEGMRQYQRLLRDLLEPSDWQTEDKNGNPLDRPFLKKSGWRKIARAFNLSASLPALEANLIGRAVAVAELAAWRHRPDPDLGPYRGSVFLALDARVDPPEAAEARKRPPAHGGHPGQEPGHSRWSAWGGVSRGDRIRRRGRRARSWSDAASRTPPRPGGSASGSPPTTATYRSP
jgi:hypothetical protein